MACPEFTRLSEVHPLPQRIERSTDKSLLFRSAFPVLLVGAVWEGGSWERRLREQLGKLILQK
jgi:hypothetical protein